MSLEFEVFAGGFCQTNGCLISHGGRHLMVDAPDDAAGWLAERGVNIDALLLTHQHFDHVMHAGRLQREHGCPLYAWAEPSESLWLNTLFSGATGWKLDIDPYTVDHRLEGMSALTAAGLDFNLLHIPGHSPDSVCFYHAPSATCFCGDTIFRQSIGRCDFPGGSQTLLVAGIREKLITLPGDVTLVPGHGPATTVADEQRENPYVA